MGPKTQKTHLRAARVLTSARTTYCGVRLRAPGFWTASLLRNLLLGQFVTIRRGFSKLADFPEFLWCWLYSVLFFPSLLQIFEKLEDGGKGGDGGDDDGW